MPHSDITPGGIEADGDHLLIPLDAVNRQLAGGCGGAYCGGIVDHIEYDSGETQTGCGRPPLLFYKKDPRCFTAETHGIKPPDYKFATTICKKTCSQKSEVQIKVDSRGPQGSLQNVYLRFLGISFIL